MLEKYTDVNFKRSTILHKFPIIQSINLRREGIFFLEETLAIQKNLKMSINNYYNCQISHLNQKKKNHITYVRSWTCDPWSKVKSPNNLYWTMGGTTLLGRSAWWLYRPWAQCNLGSALTTSVVPWKISLPSSHQRLLLVPRLLFPMWDLLSSGII